ncbi:MAG: archease [Gemmataceae bacterium]
MYEHFDHTADLGLRVRAADLDTLFAEAGEALTAAIVENPEAIQAARELHVVLPKDDLEYLLFDWLKALLYHFEAERLVCARFEVRVGDEGLRGLARGETFDPSRHEPAHEVKAITYHDLKVERDGDGWMAEVIVDI